jgi:4-amino-4-deoxy-L-arabinose transferase-like glycosyltransferase
VLRVAWALYAAREPFGFFGGDQTAYLEVGRGIADGDGYRSLLTGEPSAFWPPGYPLVVAAVALATERGPLPGELPAWLAALQAVIGAATIVPVWWLAQAATGRRRAATIAAALMAVWPSLVLYTATFHLETVFIAMLVGSLALLARGAHTAGGFALGCTVLVRPFALPVVALVAIARRSWSAAWLVAALVLAVQVPWVLRNAVVLDAFVPSSTNSGDTLCIDHRDGGTGAFAFPVECFAGLEDVPPDRLEVERNERNLRAAVRWTFAHPSEELSRWPTRAEEMWRDDTEVLEAVESGGWAPFLPSWLRSTLEAVTQWWYAVWAPIGAVGVVWLVLDRRRRARPATVLVAGTAASLVVISLALYGLPRFHIPVLPFLAITAAGLVDATLLALRTRGRPRTAPPAP